MKIRIGVLILANLVGGIVALFALYSLEGQNAALSLILSKYTTFNIEELKSADKNILIKVIESSNNQYQFTERLYQKAVINLSNIIFILIGVIAGEVFVLTFLVLRLGKAVKASTCNI